MYLGTTTCITTLKVAHVVAHAFFVLRRLRFWHAINISGGVPLGATQAWVSTAHIFRNSVSAILYCRTIGAMAARNGA